MMAISSPFSIIFWTSIGSQIALLAHTASYGLEWMVLGVILATISWDFLLNGFLHLARHRLPQAIIHWFNRLGGVILISMALFSLWYVFDKIKF
jgi:threonine/homoserine/homoserine lactone efflux protein